MRIQPGGLAYLPQEQHGTWPGQAAIAQGVENAGRGAVAPVYARPTATPLYAVVRDDLETH